MVFPMFSPCFPRQPGTTFRLGGSEAADSASRLVRQAAHEKGKAKAAERLGRAFDRRCEEDVDDDGFLEATLWLFMGFIGDIYIYMGFVGGIMDNTLWMWMMMLDVR